MSLFFPTKRVKEISEIKAEQLKGMGIKGIILDVDNTLTTHGSQHVEQKVLDWLENISKEGFELMIVSNNFNHRIKPFADKLGLDYIAVGCKPLSGGFIRSRKKFDVSKKEMVIVGDQMFTDILGANLYGCKSIMVEPIKLEESSSFIFRRKLENKILSKYNEV